MADPVVGTGKMTCIEDVDAPTKREPTGAKFAVMQFIFEVVYSIRDSWRFTLVILTPRSG